jgi:hypothetical protein
MNWRVVILSSLMPFAGTGLIAQQFGSQQSVLTVDPDQPTNGFGPPSIFLRGCGSSGWRPGSSRRRGGGLRVDSRRFLAFEGGSYDNGRKRNDGDEPHPKGHDRGLDGAAYCRFSSGWLFGAGAASSQLSTRNYLVAAVLAFGRPLGGGLDDLDDLSRWY